MSEPTEQDCQNCDCKQDSEHRLSDSNKKYWFIDDHVRMVSTSYASELVDRVIDACTHAKGQ